MAKALTIEKGGLVWVNEGTVLEENGKQSRPFPREGVIDHTGQFRDPTPLEVADREHIHALKREAAEAKSPISLRPHRDGHYLVCFKHGAARVPIGQTFNPGTVVALTAEELKSDPFVSNGTINDNPIETRNEIVCGATLERRGAFRLQYATHDSTRVFRIVYNYGFFPIGSNAIEVDGTTFSFA